MRRFSTYSYGFNNPIRFVDPDGMAPTDWVREGGRYMWDDRVVDQKTAEEFHGKEASYIAPAATVTARPDGVMGAPVSLNADGTITQLGETLSVNSDRKFTNSNGSEFVPRQTEGNYLGVSAGFSAIGGFGVSAGFVKDAMGDTEAYLSVSGNIGIGAGVEGVAGTITPSGGNQFLTSDFRGGGSSYSGGISTPFIDFGGAYGGSASTETVEYNPFKFGTNARGYTTKQGGLTQGTGVGASLMFSTSTTWVTGK